MKNYIHTAWRLKVKFAMLKGAKLYLGLWGVKLEIVVRLQRLNEILYWGCL